MVDVTVEVAVAFDFMNVFIEEVMSDVKFNKNRKRANICLLNDLGKNFWGRATKFCKEYGILRNEDECAKCGAEHS